METKTAPPAARASRRVLALAAVFVGLEGYDLSSYGTTIPSLLKDTRMGADKASAGAVGSLLAVGMLIGAAFAAVLIRRVGSQRLLLGSAALFSFGTLGCAVASPFVVFGGVRLIVGIGLGIVLPTMTTYVADLPAAERRSRNVGIMMAGYAVGALLAPLLAAALLPETSWRWIYVIGSVPAVVLLPLAARLLPESPVTPTHATGASKEGRAGLRALFAPGVAVAGDVCQRPRVHRLTGSDQCLHRHALSRSPAGPRDRTGSVGGAARRNSRTEHGGAILSSSLDVRWNFYLFAIPGVVGAVLAALVPLIRPARTPAAVAQPGLAGVAEPCR
ncbi:MFS transporter [Streptomyces krungchingensis]